MAASDKPTEDGPWPAGNKQAEKIERLCYSTASDVAPGLVLRMR